MNEIVGSDNELESLGNYFFNKFANSVKENDRLKCFRIIVRSLVRLGDDDSGGYFEVFRPMA